MHAYLLAAIANSLAIANWQRQQDDTIPKPTPIAPPGVDLDDGNTYGSAPIPASQFNDWWDNN